MQATTPNGSCSGRRHGGDLWLCNFCDRMVCWECITVPQDYLQLVLAPDVDFECMYCHWLKSQRAKTVTPYSGFYRQGIPVLPDGILINKYMELSHLSDSTLIIHLRLQSMPADGPVEMASNMLTTHFPNGGFRFIDLPFDIGTPDKLMRYKCTATCLASELRSVGLTNIMVAFTDLSNGGNLFIGTASSSQPQVVPPSECLDMLLSPFDNVFDGGSVVRDTASFSDFQKAVVQHQFSHTIVLDVFHLLPSVPANFVLSIVEQSFIEGLPMHTAFHEALGTSSRLGLHSNIVLLSLTYNGTARHLTTSKYTCSHPDTRPWGQPLPLQCHQCFCIVQWRRLSKPPNPSGAYEFQCTNESCGSVDGSVQAKTIAVTRPDNVTLLERGRGEGSVWLEIPLGVRMFAF